MSVNLSPFAGAGAQFFTDTGSPLTGGLLYSYAAGTTTPATTYTDNNGSVANSNPIVLDAAGRVPYEIWLTSGTTYKFVLKTSLGVTIGTWDNIDGINDVAVGTSFYADAFTTTAGQTTFTLSANPGSINNLNVSLDGAVLTAGADFTWTGTSLVLTMAAFAGQTLRVAYSSVAGVKAISPGSVVDASVATGTKLYNRVYAIASFLDFGAVADGATSNTAALNAVIAAAALSPTTMKVFVPRGVYYFNTQPNNITAPIMLVGEGRNTTYFVRNYSGASNDVGLLNFRATGQSSAVEDLLICSGNSTTGGCLISVVQPSSGDGGDWCRFNNLRLTSSVAVGGAGNSHAFALYFDGSARTSPLGLRSTWVQDCIIFGGTSGAAYIKSVVNFNWMNTPTYSGGGTSGMVVLTGTSAVNSYNVTIQGPAIYSMDLDYCQHVVIDTAEMNGWVTNTTNVSNVFARYNQTSGSTQNSWINSNWISPATVQNPLLMERGAGGNQWTARYNSSNQRAGIYTGGTSGQTFIGGNLTWSTGNVFNFDQTGAAWYMGDPGGNGRLAIGSVTGTAGNDASVTGSSDALRLDTSGNIWPGRASASNMTNGFFYIPSASAAPSGTPTAISGYVPMYYDSSANQFYVYNGAWKKVTLA
jgi:hypothetical protein